MVDSGGGRDNYRIYIMVAAVQEMQYDLYVFSIHQTETVLYSQIRRNYIVMLLQMFHVKHSHVVQV